MGWARRQVAGLMVVAALVVPVGAQTHGKPAKDIPKTTHPFSEVIDGKSIKWNAVLVPAQGQGRAGVEVVVDLSGLSVLKMITSMSVTVDFLKDGKNIMSKTLSFPLDKSGPIAGGQKVKHVFEISDRKLIAPGVVVQPGTFSGTVDSHVYVYQEPKDPTHGQA